MGVSKRKLSQKIKKRNETEIPQAPKTTKQRQWAPVFLEPYNGKHRFGLVRVIFVQSGHAKPAKLLHFSIFLGSERGTPSSVSHTITLPPMTLGHVERLVVILTTNPKLLRLSCLLHGLEVQLRPPPGR